jgi:hypothetical protein
MITYTNTFIVNSEEALGKLLKPFNKDKSTFACTKALAVDPVNGSISIPTTGLSGAIKIELITKLSGNINSIYATDINTTGKPYVFEVEDATKAVEVISSVLTQVNDKSLKCTAGEGAIVFTGDNYTMFLGANVFTWDSAKNDWTKASVTPTPTKCVNGFGTYEQLTKDIRLLSEGNTGLAALHADEWPIQGKKYNQYIITCTTSGRILGGEAVGASVTSTTNHVFFINQDIATNAETTIKKELNIATIA